MKTIVVAYDDSDASKRALERSAELAKAFGSTVCVTSVARVLQPASGHGAGGIDPTDTPQDHVDELEHARSYLEAQDVSAKYQAAIGHPSETIVEVAREQSADLIVIGTRELGKVQRMLGQSVSDAVVHHAHCDVLIVH